MTFPAHETVTARPITTTPKDWTSLPIPTPHFTTRTHLELPGHDDAIDDGEGGIRPLRRRVKLLATSAVSSRP
jgi:hypothetical protein